MWPARLRRRAAGTRRATDPWPGAYGFFAAAALTSDSVVMSTWVIDQPTDENWVEVFSKPFVIQ